MAYQETSHDRPLRAGALAVNQPYFLHSGLTALPEILLDYRSDLLRRKGMQVENVLEGKPHRLIERPVLSLVEGLLRRSAHVITLARCLPS